MKKFLVSILFFLTISSLAEAKMVSVAAEKANLHAEPNSQSSVLWEFGKGYPLQILSTKGSWYKVVDFENDTGWVARETVDKTSYMIVKRKRINIRSGPSSKSRLIGKADHGVVFQSLKQTKGWAQIKHENGLTGWVRRDLVWGF